MKILYFYQYFSTSEGAWGTRVYEFAKNWVNQGHEVTVVTSVYAKSDLKASGMISESIVEGIRVIVINIRIDNRQSILRRILSFLQYAIVSSWYAVAEEADVVIASSGPITVGIPGLVARWFRRRTLIFEARDLWPEGAIMMGLLRGKVAVGLARYFESLCYRNASGIVGLSPGIAEDIKRRFPGRTVTSITNAANINLFSTRVDLDTSKHQRYAVYFGNLGEVNHSSFLLDVAAELLRRNRGEIKILLIGDGQLKSMLKNRIEQERLENVHLLDLMPKSKLVAFIQQAMVSLIPLKPLPVFDTSSPNKLFESLAAGVPVIQTTQGWIKDFLEEHQIGFTVSAEDPRQMTDKLIYLHDHAVEGRQMGERAASVARQYFDKDILAHKMLTTLRQAHER